MALFNTGLSIFLYAYPYKVPIRNGSFAAGTQYDLLHFTLKSAPACDQKKSVILSFLWISGLC